MKAERLIYTFVSYASHFENSWGHGSPEEGVERIAGLAHRYGIPVTWIVNSGSISVLNERICQWHERYGDNVILSCDVDVHGTPEKENLKRAIQQEWEILQKAFPWVKTKVAGRGRISNDFIEVLEELDFNGLWGYCWEQTWWDGISHRGIPWGYWYIDSGRYKIPSPGKGKLVACEWTARDLNLAYHTGSPCIYSTDPNDVLRAGLCTSENIEYWKKLFDGYLQNTENNEEVFFLHQQEAHEMESGGAFNCVTPADISASADMLDKFFQYLKRYPIHFTSVPEAVEQYHRKNKETAPVYMLVKDSGIRPEINAYTMTLGGVGLGPWPETFLYYDKECQMAFVEGECKPRLFRSYPGKTDMDGEFKEPVPSVFVKKFEKSDHLIEIGFEVDSCQPLPFGLTYWDGLTGFEIKSARGVSHVRKIQEKLVFLKMTLTGGKQAVGITLEKV